VTDRPALPILGPGEPIPDIKTTEHTYNWLHVGGFALWIISPMTLHEAVEAMALAYEVVNKP